MTNTLNVHELLSSMEPVISYSYLTFYQNFVASYQIIEKKKKQLYSLKCRRRNIVPNYLLLCGDVHPCPGPMGRRCDNIFDYKMF